MAFNKLNIFYIEQMRGIKLNPQPNQDLENFSAIFSLASLMYTRLRRTSSRVIDVMYLTENQDYAKYVIQLVQQTKDQALIELAERLTQLLKLESQHPMQDTPPLDQQESEIYHHEPSPEEIYKAQVSHHYIGALR